MEAPPDTATTATHVTTDPDVMPAGRARVLALPLTHPAMPMTACEQSPSVSHYATSDRRTWTEP